MKKSVTASLAAMMLLSASTAMAATFPEFDFNGDIKTHYRWETKTGAADTEGGKVWFRLNATSEVAKNVNFYTRLTTQRLTGDNIGADFDDKHYHADHANTLDRIGFVVNGKDFKATIGRQGATLGGLALLYSTDGYLGTNMGAIDGVAIAGKSGATNVKVVVGEQWDDKAADTKLYAVDASYSPAKDLTVGGTLMQIDAANDTNFWAVNGAYTTGKATWLGEYGKSDTDANDTAYALGVTYGFDKKNSAYVFYSKVESDFGWTDFDANMKGMYYGFSHKMTKDYTVDFFYKNMEYLTGTDANKEKTSLRTTLTYKF